MQIRLDGGSWLSIAFACVLAAIAHAYSGLIWGKILTLFQVRISPQSALNIYLKTNFAKYLPGNVWHFYGRMTAVVESGSTWGVASLSVLLEPLLLAAAASLVAAIGIGIQVATVVAYPWLQVTIPLVLFAILIGIHPRFFNPVIQKVSRGKTGEHQPILLQIYPWQLLLGEVAHMVLRGVVFLLIWQAIAPLDIRQIPQLLGIYSGAWLAGFIVPGAPGGIGVFETVALLLLSVLGQTDGNQGDLLIIVAIVRLVNTMGEILPFLAMGWWQKFSPQTKQ